jgi:hypothetical protein
MWAKEKTLAQFFRKKNKEPEIPCVFSHLGSKRLRKRVYGEASFAEASAVTGSLPVAVKDTDLCIFRSLHFASLYQACTKYSASRLPEVRGWACAQAASASYAIGPSWIYSHQDTETQTSTFL